MTESSMTFSDQVLLEKCREIEFLCRDLYDFFAELYSDNEDAVRLWRKTAMEEQNHADQFTLALKLKKGLSCHAKIDPVKVDSIILQISSIAEKLKAHPPTFQHALSSSIKLEYFLQEFHLGCVVEFEESSFKALFRAMMANDQDHIGSLQAAFDKLKVVA